MKFLITTFISLFGFAHASDVPTWQIVYWGKYSPQKMNYVILDLFEHSSSDVGKAKRVGAKPIAYFSAHYENWRPDAKQFGRKIKRLGKWQGEYYIDWRSSQTRAVMRSRLDRAKRMGFWGVDIDNIDGPMGREYFPWLYAEAKKRGLAVGLKNFVEILPQFGSKVDFFVSEATSIGELECYRKYGKPTVRMYYRRGARTPNFVYQVVSKSNGNRF